MESSRMRVPLGQTPFPGGLRKRRRLVVGLAIAVAILIPNLSAFASDPTQVSSTIGEVARLDPSRPIEAVVTLRSSTSPATALSVVAGSQSVLALYHGWRGPRLRLCRGI